MDQVSGEHWNEVISFAVTQSFSAVFRSRVPQRPSGGS